MRSTVWMWIPALSVALVGAAPPPEKDAWTLTKGQGGGCRLDSDKGALSDGYQNTSVQVRVTPTEVRVVSESTFDDSKKDLRVQVDRQEEVKADALDGAKAVVFKGAAASTLPVERPSRYYLAVNLKTARALGLTLPPSLLQRADQVLE